MGDVFWGLHTPLAAKTVETLNLTTAIETGTYFGFGALQLGSFCDRVISIESDQRLSEFAATYYATAQGVEFISGLSPDVLPGILADHEEPTLFVLDAHWFPMSFRPQVQPEKQCYLDEELALIGDWFRRGHAGAVLIDDAQMLLGSLRKPWRRGDFPPITSVVDTLRSFVPWVTVTDDILLGGPAELEAVVRDYLHWRDELGFP
jgi:hypothetical protein